MGHSRTAWILLGSVAIPLSLTTCPRKATSRRARWHFPGFTFSPADSSLPKTSPSRCRWLGKSRENTTISSRYTKHEVHCNPRMATSMSLSKVPGALQRPKGITVN